MAEVEAGEMGVEVEEVEGEVDMIDFVDPSGQVGRISL
jgi:hypothetical protein